MQSQEPSLKHAFCFCSMTLTPSIETQPTIGTLSSHASKPTFLVAPEPKPPEVLKPGIRTLRWECGFECPPEDQWPVLALSPWQQEQVCAEITCWSKNASHIKWPAQIHRAHVFRHTWPCQTKFSSVVDLRNAAKLHKPRRQNIWEFPRIWVPYFGVLIIRILLFRVLCWGPLFSETPICHS